MYRSKSSQLEARSSQPPFLAFLLIMPRGIPVTTIMQSSARGFANKLTAELILDIVNCFIQV